jgi:hypothetical protein
MSIIEAEYWLLYSPNLPLKLLNRPVGAGRFNKYRLSYLASALLEVFFSDLRKNVLCCVSGFLFGLVVACIEGTPKKLYKYIN